MSLFSDETNLQYHPAVEINASTGAGIVHMSFLLLLNKIVRFHRFGKGAPGTCRITRPIHNWYWDQLRKLDYCPQCKRNLIKPDDTKHALILCGLCGCVHCATCMIFRDGVGRCPRYDESKHKKLKPSKYKTRRVKRPAKPLKRGVELTLADHCNQYPWSDNVVHENEYELEIRWDIRTGKKLTPEDLTASLIVIKKILRKICKQGLPTDIDEKMDTGKLRYFVWEDTL